MVMGIDNINENSTAVFLDRPDSSPPTMVDPERETPGTIDKIWYSPIFSALELFTSSMVLNFGFLKYLSTSKKAIPPSINDAATINSVCRYSFIYL